MSVLIETTLGDIVVDLFTQQRPRSSLNFIKLCKIKFYNYCLFHSVESNFLAQTGDPSGTGRGGESVFTRLYGEQARYFEMESNPKMRHSKRGTISMVNNGENLHGSQFFITLADNLDYLDGNHTVFGEVAEGFHILTKFNEAICDETHRPYVDIRIIRTIILDDPFEDPVGLVIPERSPSPTLEQLKGSRIGLDEVLDDDKDKPPEEVHEKIEEKEAMARAHILEMVGDLHYAEEKPPDNVLFVCKLNPVTTEDDLNVIFSRFGNITGCEVIKDRKTGDSLQYAFIEFEKPEYCENAYFKMDNVLIDDRRIHVDFSQSVSKNFQWKRDLGKSQGKQTKHEFSEGNVRQRVNARTDSRQKEHDSKMHRHQDQRRINRSRSRSSNRNHYHRRRSRSRSHGERHKDRHHERRRSRSRDRDSNHRFEQRRRH